MTTGPAGNISRHPQSSIVDTAFIGHDLVGAENIVAFSANAAALRTFAARMSVAMLELPGGDDVAVRCVVSQSVAAGAVRIHAADRVGQLF